MDIEASPILRDGHEVRGVELLDVPLLGRVQVEADRVAGVFCLVHALQVGGIISGCLGNPAISERDCYHYYHCIIRAYLSIYLSLYIYIHIHTNDDNIGIVIVIAIAIVVIIIIIIIMALALPHFVYLAVSISHCLSGSL